MRVTSAALIHEARESLACTAATMHKLSVLATELEDPLASTEFLRLFLQLRHILRSGIGSDDAATLINAHVRSVEGWVSDQQADEPSIGEEALAYLRAK